LVLFDGRILLKCSLKVLIFSSILMRKGKLPQSKVALGFIGGFKISLYPISGT